MGIRRFKSPKCHPNLPFHVEDKFEFDPKEYGSLDIGLIGFIKDSDVKFVPYDGNAIVIATKIKVNSEEAKKHVKVGSRIKDGHYQWGVKGPNYIINHGECASVQVTVHVPKVLKEYGEIFVKITGGAKVDTNYGPIKLEKFRLDLAYGDIKFKGNHVNYLTLDSDFGHIEVEDVKAASIYLASKKGDITAKNVGSYSFSANSQSGKVSAILNKATRVYSNVLNGQIELKMNKLNEDDAISVSTRVANGNSYVCLPDSYKGKFFDISINGKAKVKSDTKDMHFTKNWRHVKKGYKGDGGSGNLVKSKTLNGNSVICFD